MLTEKKMKKIALPECVEMLGKDFVYQRKIYAVIVGDLMMMVCLNISC